MEDVCFLTMERIEGRPLSAVITQDGLTPIDFYELVLPILDAVCAAHQKGIIHRDLKPDNIMVTDDGRVKVLDSDLAKLRYEPVEADTVGQGCDGHRPRGTRRSV
jgi:serine/threonine-protein kinase